MPDKPNKIFQFWQELKRRKVFRLMAMYAATAFIIMEAADIMLPRLGLPDWTVTLLIIILLIGFPVAAVVSWIYDITPEGILKTKQVETEKKESQASTPGRNIINANNIVIAILFAAVCILLYPKVFKQDIVHDKSNTGKESIDLIAVLPFTNTKSDPETDYLGFAIADQVIGNLIYLKSISVRSSGSVRKYKNRDIDPISVGDSLKVDYVLIGNYFIEDNKVRLNIELIKVSTNEMIWREPIEVDFNSVFELQDIVSQKVVEGLHIQFSQKELDNLGKDKPQNPQAYEFYIKGISYPYDNEGDQIAIKMLKRSIELDSTYAPAYAQLGDRTHRLAQFGLHDPEETLRAENYYLKALSLNKENIFALAGLAQLYTETARIEEALELTRQILEINPNNAEAHFSLGYIYRYAGMNNEALQEMEKAVGIDPENPGFRSIVITYQYVGDYINAIDKIKNYDQSSYMLSVKGMTFLMMGNNEDALDFSIRSIAVDPEGLAALFATAIVSYIEGDYDKGLEAGYRFENSNVLDAEAWYTQARVYGLLGNRDGCIRCLRKAIDGGFFNYPILFTDIFFEPLRDDAEFQVILEIAKEKHIAFQVKYF